MNSSTVSISDENYEGQYSTENKLGNKLLIAITPFNV